MSEKETKPKAAKPAAEKKPAAKEAKPLAPKAAAAQKAAAAAKVDKAEAKPAVKKEAKPAKQASGGQIRLVQTGSPIGRQAVQRQTLIGLGLNKLHRERVLEDSPAVRGMVEKVKHLVKVSQA